MNQNIYIEKDSKLKYLNKSNSNSKKAVFLMHGYGASMYDLFDLYSVINFSENCDWYFPNGPLGLGPQFGNLAAAWFPVNMEELQRAMEMGVSRSFEDKYSDEFQKSLMLLETFVLNISKNYDSIAIGGFSQGAMLSSHLANRVGDKIKELILFSGNLIGKDQLISSLKESPNYKVFQSHGMQDPVLGFDGAVKLKELLENNNKEVLFESFKGVHEIPMQVIHSINHFLSR